MSRYAFRDVIRPDGAPGPEEYTVDLETVESTEISPRAETGRVNLTIRYNTGKEPDRVLVSQAEAQRFRDALLAFRAVIA
jgi:hypothetical protein